MQDILFKGFYPDENGKTVITLNGEKIRGDWVIGNYFYGESFTDNDKKEYQILMGNSTVRISYDVIPETVVIYVKNDMDGNRMFNGDIVKSAVSDDIPHGEIRYDDKLCKFYVSINDDYDIIDIDEYEPIVIGNKWEIDNE